MTATNIATTTADTITWTAYSNSSYLRGERQARSMMAAVRDARDYLRNELFGEGRIVIAINGTPCRIDERSIFTGYRWRSYRPY